MVGVRLELDLDGKEAALAALAGIAERARNPLGMFEQIGMSLVTSTQHRFQEQHGPDGSPWPPSLRALYSQGKTLIKTARLLRSVTFEASARGVEVGSNVIYAAIHQLGGDIRQMARTAVLHFKTNKRTGRSSFAKPGKADRARKAEIGARVIRMPARPFLGLDDDDGREIVRIAEDWIAGEVAP